MSDSKGYKNICDEYPIKVIFNGYDSYWKGQNEYAVYVKKNHSKFSFGYEKYWLVYGKVKYIHLFMDPCSPYAYFMDELKQLKYMTLDKKKIRLWNDKKDFNIKFLEEEDKQYFDEFYKKACMKP